MPIRDAIRAANGPCTRFISFLEKKHIILYIMPTNPITSVEPFQDAAFAANVWRGFQGNVGGGIGVTNYTNLSPDATFGGATTSWPVDSQNSQGATGAVSVGYNYDVSQEMIVGVGIENIPVKTSKTYDSKYEGMPLANKIQLGNIFNTYVTPGYAWDKDRMVYAKLGYSVATLALETSEPATASKGLTGYIVGLGYKQIITGGLYGFVEGNYMNYGKATVNSQFSAYALTTEPTVASTSYAVGVGYKL